MKILWNSVFNLIINPMNKIILLCVILLFALGGRSQDSVVRKTTSIDLVFKQFVQYQGFKPAVCGFYAVDINSGEVLSSHNIDKSFRPASTQKLVTTAAALEVLHPDYRFTTYLAYTGKIIDSINYLKGNLIIIGGGDPSLGSKYFDSKAKKQFLKDFVAAVKKAGIDSMSGGVIGDAQIYSHDIVPPSWSWQNMGNYFGAGACGLSIYDNYFNVVFKTENYGDPAMITSYQPHIPSLYFDNEVVADSIFYDNVNIYGAPYDNRRTARGGLPLNRDAFKVKASMPDPAFFATLQLDSALRSANIIPTKKPNTIRQMREKSQKVNFNYQNITSFYSPELKSIIEQTNTHSINLFAEHCLVQTGLRLGAQTETSICADSLMAFWHSKGMDIQGMSLNDGSGLSQYNVVTPRQMVFMLTYMKKQSPYFDDFYNSLPIGGQTGTLSNMFSGTSAYGNVHAKSGTITRVKAYSGYVTSASGREIAFYVVVNNFSCSSKEARIQMQKLMVALADFKE